MKFFDTHIHLQDMPDITPEALKASGIAKCICVSAKASDWEKAAAWAVRMPETVVPAFALHPWYINNAPSDWTQQLDKYLQRYPNALIGECGFDRLKNPDFEKQAEAFEIQLALAKKHHRTLLIHAVKAWGWLDNYWRQLPEKFVFHSFNSHVEQLKQIVKYGGYVSVNSNIFKSKSFFQIIQSVPLDRLLIESDAPFQGRIDELEGLCQQIALIRRQKLDIIIEALYNNAMEIVKND